MDGRWAGGRRSDQWGDSKLLTVILLDTDAKLRSHPKRKAGFLNQEFEIPLETATRDLIFF